MIVYLYDFLRFYYNDAINLMDISHLKKWLKEDGHELDEINLILDNLGKKVQIKIIYIGHCFENLIIIGDSHIYFDSNEKFKN